MPSTKVIKKTAIVENKDGTEREQVQYTITVPRKIAEGFDLVGVQFGWTTSKEFVIRPFYFGFAVLLYNMWLLVDFLVQIGLDVEHRYKPGVTAKRFLNLARKNLGKPG